MTTLYAACCPRCGSTAALPEPPEKCRYCPPLGDHTAARRRLGRWLLACVLLGTLAGLLR